MNEESKFAVLLSCINTIVVADVVLFAISFVLAGFAIGALATPLAYLGAATLLLGLVVGSGYAPSDLPKLLAGMGLSTRPLGAGRPPINPMDNYADSVEQQLLEPRLDGGSQEENREYGIENLDGLEKIRERAKKNAQLSISLTIASLLALGFSFVFGRLFPG